MIISNDGEFFYLENPNCLVGSGCYFFENEWSPCDVLIMPIVLLEIQ